MITNTASPINETSVEPFNNPIETTETAGNQEPNFLTKSKISHILFT